MTLPITTYPRSANSRSWSSLRGIMDRPYEAKLRVANLWATRSIAASIMKKVRERRYSRDIVSSQHPLDERACVMGGRSATKARSEGFAPEDAGNSHDHISIQTVS